MTWECEIFAAPGASAAGDLLGRFYQPRPNLFTNGANTGYCKMGSLDHEPFCKVCAHAIIDTVAGLTGMTAAQGRRLETIGREVAGIRNDPTSPGALGWAPPTALQLGMTPQLAVCE